MSGNRAQGESRPQTNSPAERERERANTGDLDLFLDSCRVQEDFDEEPDLNQLAKELGV